MAAFFEGDPANNVGLTFTITSGFGSEQSGRIYIKGVTHDGVISGAVAGGSGSDNRIEFDFVPSTVHTVTVRPVLMPNNRMDWVLVGVTNIGMTEV